MQPAAYGILDPGIVVRIHGGERRACQRRPHAVLVMVSHAGAMMVETSMPSYPFVVANLQHAPLFPAGATGSTSAFGAACSRFESSAGSHADPTPERPNPSSRSGVTAIRNTRFSLSRLVDIRMARDGPTRRFTRRVGTGLSGRGAGVRPNVRKGRHRRLKPTGLATVCKTVHGWVRLPRSPLIGYG